MINILIVEDEENILKLMQIRLKKSGFNVLSAVNGKEALEIIKSNNISLVIADIMMPVMDGYELVKNIRADNLVIPIIMTTAKETIEDKKLGFELGIDDYMVKPINHEELLLRINAILKRSGIKSDGKIQIENILFDFENLKISNSTSEVILTKKEFDLLFKLLKNNGHTLTKDQLLTYCWGYENESYEETLKVHINRLRNKVKQISEVDIETIRGVGYKGVINVR